MASLMRCTESHWQGDVFVAKGTFLPATDPKVIATYFEPYIDDDEPAKKPTRRAAK